MINAYWEPLEFELPLLGHGDRWHRILDTSLLPPEDWQPLTTAAPVLTLRYRVEARSSVVLMVKPIYH